MASIVIELQQESLNPAVHVSDLLRKALVVANKLDLSELRQWVDNELSGYSDATALPPYRRLVGQVMGQDEWGRWIPIRFQDDRMRQVVSAVSLFDPVAELEALLRRTDGTSGTLSVEFSNEQNEILRRNSVSGRVDQHTRYLRAEDLRGLLDAVRTEILRWSLRLEKGGILGEEMAFSKAEQQRASEVHFTSHYYGDVGNIAQNSQHVRQTADLAIQLSDLPKLVLELGEHLRELGLDESRRRRAEAQIATIKAQLGDEPDSVIVAQAVRTLRSVTEGAIGSLLATTTQPAVVAAWHWIQAAMRAIG